MRVLHVIVGVLAFATVATHAFTGMADMLYLVLASGAPLVTSGVIAACWHFCRCFCFAQAQRF